MPCHPDQFTFHIHFHYIRRKNKDVNWKGLKLLKIEEKVLFCIFVFKSCIQWQMTAIAIHALDIAILVCFISHIFKCISSETHPSLLNFLAQTVSPLVRTQNPIFVFKVPTLLSWLLYISRIKWNKWSLEIMDMNTFESRILYFVSYVPLYS